MTNYLRWLKKSKWSPLIVGGAVGGGLNIFFGLTLMDWQFWLACVITAGLIIDYKHH